MYCFCFDLYVCLYVSLYAGCEGAGSFAGARCSLAHIYIYANRNEVLVKLGTNALDCIGVSTNVPAHFHACPLCAVVLTLLR